MLVPMKVTAYFRDVVRLKHPGIEEAWIQRVISAPLEERQQPDGRPVGACGRSTEPCAQSHYP